MTDKTKINKPVASIVVVIDENYAIGKENNLLCHLPNDLKHFKAITLHNRKSAESLANLIQILPLQPKTTSCRLLNGKAEQKKHSKVKSPNMRLYST